MPVPSIWSRLWDVKLLTFEAQTRAATSTGWCGTGTGNVVVDNPAEGVLVFREKGMWTQEGGRPCGFSNVFRWTLNPEDHSIRLEHLRFGSERPVYLFDLVQINDTTWHSSEPHHCREDLYSARLQATEEALCLSWTVNGPDKAESLVYQYRGNATCSSDE